MESENCFNNLNLKSKFSDTAFHLACRKGHSHIAELILNHSAILDIDLNCQDSFGKTAFSLTCEFGHMKITEMILKNCLEKKIDLNTKDRAGWTPFQLACKYGYLNIAEMIIKVAFSGQKEKRGKRLTLCQTSSKCLANLPCSIYIKNDK